MGQIKQPEPVKLIVGMISQRETLFSLAEEAMRALWGEIDLASEVLIFDQTTYYAKSMGDSLLRKLVSFEKLIDPGALAKIKHQSNELEEKLAKHPEGKKLQVKRPINLDPGYIEPSKLVLASTKNYSHRIYIGESMYAETTLHFHKGRWQAWPFTYPDYGSGLYDPFLNQARTRLLEQVSSAK
jgi:hypothetical protein